MVLSGQPMVHPHLSMVPGTSQALSTHFLHEWLPHVTMSLPGKAKPPNSSQPLREAHSLLR